MPAQIIHIPMQFGNDRPYVPPADPRHQDVIQPRFTPPTEEEWRRLDGAEAVARLIEEFGAARVARWVRNIADLKGEAI